MLWMYYLGTRQEKGAKSIGFDSYRNRIRFTLAV